MSNVFRNERSRSNAAHSNRSSPAGGQTDNIEAGPQPPFMKSCRASSVERTSAEGRDIPIDDASAAAALQQAIQASPHKFRGTQDLPMQLGDLTPQPTRRILFPSPSKSQEASSKRNSMSRSIQSPYDASKEDPPQADKENCPPPINDPDFSDVPDPDQDPTIRGTTPMSPATSKAHLFKTPLRTPKRSGPPPTTGDFFSSAAKAFLRPGTDITPNRTPTRNSSVAQPLDELSPFTAHLNQLLSNPSYNNNNDSNDGNDGSPTSNRSFSFPSLPSLHNTPNRPDTSSHVMEDFDFSAFDSQDLISTDVPMPSSPPVWFGVYEDGDVDLDGGLWGDDALPTMTGSSPLKAAPASPMKRTPRKSLHESSPSTRMPGKGFSGESPRTRAEENRPVSSPLKDLGRGERGERAGAYA